MANHGAKINDNQKLGLNWLIWWSQAMMWRRKIFLTNVSTSFCHTDFGSTNFAGVWGVPHPTKVSTYTHTHPHKNLRRFLPKSLIKAAKLQKSSGIIQRYKCSKLTLSLFKSSITNSNFTWFSSKKFRQAIAKKIFYFHVLLSNKRIKIGYIKIQVDFFPYASLFWFAANYIEFY